jgi:hypothetical protein
VEVGLDLELGQDLTIIQGLEDSMDLVIEMLALKVIVLMEALALEILVMVVILVQENTAMCKHNREDQFLVICKLKVHNQELQDQEKDLEVMVDMLENPHQV